MSNIIEKKWFERPTQVGFYSMENGYITYCAGIGVEDFIIRASDGAAILIEEILDSAPSTKRVIEEYVWIDFEDEIASED